MAFGAGERRKIGADKPTLRSRRPSAKGMIHDFCKRKSKADDRSHLVSDSSQVFQLSLSPQNNPFVHEVPLEFRESAPVRKRIRGDQGRMGKRGSRFLGFGAEISTYSISRWRRTGQRSAEAGMERVAWAWRVLLREGDPARIRQSQPCEDDWGRSSMREHRSASVDRRADAEAATEERSCA